MRKLIIIAALLLASPAFAFEKPYVINSEISSPNPYGEGTLRRLFIKVYDAALYTDADTWSMQVPFALAIKYDVSIEAQDLVDRSIEEMEHIGQLPEDKKEDYRKQLARVMTNVKNGDTITALYDPKHGVSFYLNDRATGSIRDIALGQAFLSIWLSPKTSEPRLRSELLGQHA